MNQKQLQGQRGFTLVELIISIAILALASGFILQMFLLSARINANTDDVDAASTVSETLVEYFKEQTTPRAILDTVMFNEPAITQEQGNGYSIIQDYDANWNPIRTQPEREAPEGARYRLEMTVTLADLQALPALPLSFTPEQPNTLDTSDEARQVCERYKISVRISRLRDTQNARLSLTNTVASKYFVYQQQ